MILSTAEVGSFLVAAGGAKTCSCTGLTPTGIQRGAGPEECSRSHSLPRSPRSGPVGGEEAAGGLPRYVCTRGIAGCASLRDWSLVPDAAGGGVPVEFNRNSETLRLFPAEPNPGGGWWAPARPSGLFHRCLSPRSRGDARAADRERGRSAGAAGRSRVAPAGSVPGRLMPPCSDSAR